MKTIATILTIMVFASCEQCYNFTIIQKTTPKIYGQPESVTTKLDKCGMTARDARKFKEATEGTTKVFISGKTYTTTTTVYY